jgi:hypothetical protein
MTDARAGAAARDDRHLVSVVKSLDDNSLEREVADLHLISNVEAQNFYCNKPALMPAAELLEVSCPLFT